MLEILRELCGIQGVAGCEDEVAEYIVKKITPHAEVTRDNLGNIIAKKRGERPAGQVIMLDAHMDEVGFTATYINDDGTVSFACTGGISPLAVFGRRVRFGEIYGVIGGKPVHKLSAEERKKPPAFDEMRIDIGTDDPEMVRSLIKPGDTAVFDCEFGPFGAGLLKGRALDDRAGCAILIDLICNPIACDAVFTFTVQEELGARGAKTAAYQVNPDIALIIEATTAADIQDVAPDKQVCKLGAGPAVSFMDGGAVYDRDLYEAAGQAAESAGIGWQPKQAVSGGNNSGGIQTARGGSRVLGISVPCRYIHSACGVIAEKDLFNTAKLIRELLGRL